MSLLFFRHKFPGKANDPWNTVTQEMRAIGIADWPFVPLVHFVLLFRTPRDFYKLQHLGAQKGGGGGEVAENRM